MIPHPTGWEVTPLDGAELVIPPEGVEAGLIRYLERLGPVRAIPDLLEEQLAADPDFEVLEVGSVRESVTGEGEHAAQVRVTGAIAGAPCQRDIGYVLLDDHYARIGGVSHRPELFDRFTRTVEYLTYNCSQMLGVRRRRFRHAAPEGWSLELVGLREEWTCPGFPGDPGAITIWPAMPLALGGETFARGLGSRSKGPYPVRAHDGLGGDRWERLMTMGDGRSFRRELVVFRDDRFVYPLRIDHTDPGHTAAFEALLRSVQPLPRSKVEAAVDRRAELLDLWN